jgi:plastocyanin
MKRIYIPALIIFFCLNTLWSKTYTITASGFAFVPSNVNAVVNDTIIFNIDFTHNAEEISQSTWNANGTNPNGGFNIPFGGGTVIVTQAKIYYYICTAHASLGMKGTISVTGITGIDAPPIRLFEVAPNPATSGILIRTGVSGVEENQLIISSIAGKNILSMENISANESIDLSDLPEGIYLVKFISGNLSTQKKLVIAK